MLTRRNLVGFLPIFIGRGMAVGVVRVTAGGRDIENLRERALSDAMGAAPLHPHKINQGFPWAS